MERLDHIKELWKTLFLKAKGAYYIKRIFNVAHEQVVKYGTTHNINLDKKANKIQIYYGEKLPFILLDDNKFKRYWNLLMMALLLYVALWVPVSICILPPTQEMTTTDVIDIIVDIIFLMDMII